jgi:hypothetical protein
MPKSFASLEKEATPNAAKLAETLHDYADSGSAINPTVVIALIKRATPTPDDRATLLGAAHKGAVNQAKKGHFKISDQYWKVAQYLLAKHN